MGRVAEATVGQLPPTGWEFRLDRPHASARRRAVRRGAMRRKASATSSLPVLCHVRQRVVRVSQRRLTATRPVLGINSCE